MVEKRIEVPYPVFPKKFEKQIKLLKKQVNNYFDSEAAKDAEREGQIDVIQSLLKNHAGTQYEELKQELNNIDEQLQKLMAEGAPDLRWLYLICGLSLFFSFVALRKATRK